MPVSDEKVVPVLDEVTYSTMAELIKFLERPARLFICPEEWEHLCLYMSSVQYDAGGPYFFVLGTRVYPWHNSYQKSVTIQTRLRKPDADHDPR